MKNEIVNKTIILKTWCRNLARPAGMHYNHCESVCPPSIPTCITPWASTRENLFSVVCEKQRRRPACASAQSDQRLCYSLSGEHSSQGCSIQNSTFLASLCSLGDCFESRFVGTPEDRFCRDEAQILFNLRLPWVVHITVS